MSEHPRDIVGALRRTAELEHEVLHASDPSRAVRQKLLDPPRSRSPVRAAVLVCASLAVAATLVVVLRKRPASLGAQFDDGSVMQIAPGMPLRATRPDGALLRFSDGSTVRLKRDAKARIAEIEASGARVALEAGTAEVAVEHRASSRWTIEAGPFAVHVTGTRFGVSWDPAANRFRIEMIEGAVLVSGCSLTAIPLHAPQSMEARCGDGEAEISMQAPASSAEPERQGSPPAPGAVPTTSATPPAGVRSSAAEPGASRVVEVPDAGQDAGQREAGTSWRVLAAEGRFREAYAAAEIEGFDAQCDAAPAPDLLALSDGARFAGRSDRSRIALMCVRRRFVGSAHAAVAAFRLGTLAFDHDGSLGEAGQWFRTCLQEQPGGSFAREASGRLMEVERLLGNAPEAQKLARQYLRSWPSGPHAPLAHSLLGD